jgi:hypothetical protein
MESKAVDYYVIKRSSRGNKKFMLITPEGRKIHFGALGMEDFTITGNEEQKKRYIKRHSNEEARWHMTKENLETPAFLSRFVLWNRPTIYASVDYIKQRLGVTIKVEI